MSDNIKEKLKTFKKLKKIFEGKKLSDDSKPQKKTKKKNKVRKSEICETCYENIIENENKDALRFTNTFHQLQTKQYCDEHERIYTDHKCKPHWCGDCGFLIKYDIEISE